MIKYFFYQLFMKIIVFYVYYNISIDLYVKIA